MFSRLPALQVIDDIGYRSLMLGFPFMTLGLIAGSVVAESTYGRIDYFDPKILLSVLMWAVYLLMVFTRLNAGLARARAPQCSPASLLLLRSWPGLRTTSAECTGLSPHEIPTHRRQSQDRARRGARAPGHS